MEMMIANRERLEAVKLHPHTEIRHSFGESTCLECHKTWYICADFGENPMSVHAQYIWGETTKDRIVWHGSKVEVTA